MAMASAIATTISAPAAGVAPLVHRSSRGCVTASGPEPCIRHLADRAVRPAESSTTERSVDQVRAQQLGRKARRAAGDKRRDLAATLRMSTFMVGPSAVARSCCQQGTRPADEAVTVRAGRTAAAAAKVPGRSLSSNRSHAEPELARRIAAVSRCRGWIAVLRVGRPVALPVIGAQR
jgi:hypothetical protein